MFKHLRQTLFQNQSDGQTLLKNTFWLSISQIASRTIRAFIIIYAARILGVHGYGVFSYAMAIVGLASLFSDFGINRILIKEASKLPALRNQYIATTLFLKLLLLGTITLIIAVISPQFARIPEALPLLPIMAVLFLSDGIREFCYAMIRSVERMEWEAWLNTFINTLAVIISLALIIIYQTPLSLAIAYALSSIIGTLIALIVMRRDLTNLKSHFNSQLINPLLLEIWPFAVINILWSVLTYTDTLMLGWMKTASDVGIYAAAQRPIQLLLVVPAVIAGSTLPMLSRLAHTNKNKFKLILEKSIGISMMLALPLALGGAMMSPDIVELFYGPSYQSSALVFRIMISGFVITFPTFIIYHAIFANDLQKKFIPHMIFSAIANIMLNLWLIPRYGAWGAALATITAQYLAYGWIFFTFKKLICFQFWPLIYKSVLVTLLMGAEIYLMQKLQIPLLLQILIASTSYIAGLFTLQDPSLKWILATIQARGSVAEDNNTS